MNVACSVRNSWLL